MSLPMKSAGVAIADEVVPPPPRVNRALVDAACRLGYRAAFRGLRLWWRLRGPAHRGALVALWHGGELLMVRSSYRRLWELPGGGIRRGETASAAALRELREEVGLDLDAGSLRLVQDGVTLWEHRRDHVRIFEAVLARRPQPRIDNREIVAAAFRAPGAVPDEATPPHVARYLARVVAAGQPISSSSRCGSAAAI